MSVHEYSLEIYLVSCPLSLESLSVMHKYFYATLWVYLLVLLRWYCTHFIEVMNCIRAFQAWPRKDLGSRIFHSVSF